MIVADRFVLLHLHKSGGTFANELVLRHGAGARVVGYHLPIDQVPESHGALPVLGFVRNPWSYYVSWFSFQRERPQPNLLYRVLSEQGAQDFNGTIRNMLELGTRADLLAQLVQGLPQQFSNRGLNLPGPRLAAIADSGLGFYSFLFRYLFGASAEHARVGRMEVLRAELPRLLESTGEPITAAFREDLQSVPSRNTSRHGANAAFYDAALQALVGRRDAALIDRFGYRFAD